MGEESAPRGTGAALLLLMFLPDRRGPMPNPDDKPAAPESAEPAVRGARQPSEVTEEEAEKAEKEAARRAIEAALALRDSGAIKPVTREEILAWRHEGHKY